MDNELAHDPYEACEDRCGHELVRGVTIADLLGRDGPYPTVSPLIATRTVVSVTAEPPSLRVQAVASPAR